VGRRVGSLLFRPEPSLRALLRTPGVSSAPPVPRRCLLPSPRHDRLGHPTFRLFCHEAARFASCWARRFAPVRRPAYARRDGSRHPAQAQRSPATPGVCYTAHRRLPWRDFHPLARNSTTPAFPVGEDAQDTTCLQSIQQGSASPGANLFISMWMLRLLRSTWPVVIGFLSGWGLIHCPRSVWGGAPPAFPARGKVPNMSDGMEMCQHPWRGSLFP
jgi:hypothetical protein